MASTRWERTAPLALLAILTILSVAPIRSYDLFWHLATGRWIVEHRALPTTDPFAIASAKVPWINGEWLFEILAYGIHGLGGLAALSWLRAILAGAIFAVGFGFAQRRSDPFAALASSCICWGGAAITLDARPSAFGALFAVLAIIAAERRSAVLCFAVTVVWMNTHPSAVIAPLIVLLLSRNAKLVAATGAALLINPFGLNGIVAPLRLATAASSGEFVNAEWLPSSISRFPLLYLAIAAAAAFLGTAEVPRKHVWRFLLLAVFAALAVRHVRNQNLFFAVYPLLVAPALPRLSSSWRAIAAAAACVGVAAAAITSPHGTGIPARRFPVETAAIIAANRLEGNIYNADQFGGYLIWSLYPERRVLTDGRNELHREYIAELGKALGNERLWRALLTKYRVDIAVEEMRPPIPVVNAATGTVQQMPASLAYWPRREWALIGYDGASMLFARRSAFPVETIRKLEIRETPER